VPAPTYNPPMATAARTPDAELLRRLRARDRQAWEELYAEYQPRLRAFAYRLTGNVHDADDLVQETFVRAVPRLDRLDPETAEIAPYLFTTTRNLFLKQVEQSKRQRPVAEVPEPALPTPIEDDPQRRLLLARQQDEVRVANAKLQPRQRLVLALRELEERSYAEIGELVGMKENAVAQLIFRARESLRTELRLVQVDPARLPEECRRFLPLLAAHLDGQLKGPRRDETLAHLAGCERCQAALADMEEASRRYRLLLLPLGAGDARAAVDDRLEAAGYWRSRPGAGRIGRRSALVALGAAGALVLAGGGTALAVELTRSPHQAALAASTRTPPPVVSGTDVVETTVATTAPIVVAKKPKAKPKPKAVVAAKPKPKVAKAKVKSKPKPKPKPTTTVTAPTVLPPEQPKLKPVPKKPKPAPKPTGKPKPKAPAPKPKPTPPPAPPPDTTAPTVTITARPGATTQTDSADVAFQANEANVAFACRLDQADYAACSSPAHLSGLGAGSHTFLVRATDKAGNVGQPASVTWTYTPPDTTPPKATITSGPSGTTTDTSASFSFSADEAGSTFQCSLDGGGFNVCESPVVYNGLAPGSHSFSVRATDKAGNTSTPATRSWTIETPLPDLVVTSFSRFSITVANQGKGKAGPSVLTITYVGTFSVPSLPPGESATFSWSTCRVAMYTAVVDRTNAVTESNESNNTASFRNTCK
jgi:RNA polymerase sigma factor (sigma-70 family)